MAIVSSAITAINPQADGRRWVQETHTDQLGVNYVINYLADAAADIQAVMTARMATLSNDLVQGEITANIASILFNGSAASIALNYSTVAQNRVALRQAYQSATRQDAIMIGDFLSSLTDAQLQALFSLTAGQVTTLRTNRLTPAATAAASIRAATGA